MDHVYFHVVPNPQKMITKPKKNGKNIQQWVFAGSHPPNYQSTDFQRKGNGTGINIIKVSGFFPFILAIIHLRSEQRVIPKVCPAYNQYSKDVLEHYCLPEVAIESPLVKTFPVCLTESNSRIRKGAINLPLWSWRDRDL